MQASAIRSSVKRQVLKTILFALPKTMNHTASRIPAFRERLKQRDLVAWIGLMDGSIGRIVEIKGGKFHSRKGPASEAQVVMSFKDAATALQALMPNRKQSDIIHNAKNFKMLTSGPDELVVWFAHTLNMSETAGLPMGTPMPDGSRRYATCTNGGPLFVYVKDGRILRVTPIEFDDADPLTLVDRSARPHIQPAAPRTRRAARPDPEVPRLFGQAHSSPHEAGRFRSRRRAKSAEQGHVRLRAHLLGRGARHRRQGD